MLGSVKEKLEALASAADAAGTSLHVHHCPRGDWLVFFGEADRVVQFGGQRELLVDVVDEACAKLVSGGGEDLAGAPPDHVAAMEAQTGGDCPADDPRLHQEAADAALADELAEIADEFEEVVQVGRANRQHLADDLGLHDRYVDGAPDSPPPGIPRRSYLPGNTPAEIAIRRAMLAVEEMPAHPLLTDAVNLLQQAREKVADFVDGVVPAPEPAILAAPPRPHITRARLEEIVEGAFRFDGIHLTAYRIAAHVVKKLGFEIVEEG